MIEKYKRALFSQQSTSFNLKQELKKLATSLPLVLPTLAHPVPGSKDVIDLNFGHGVTELQLYLDEKSEVMLNTITTSDNSDDLRTQLRAAVKVALGDGDGAQQQHSNLV